MSNHQLISLVREFRGRLSNLEARSDSLHPMCVMLWAEGKKGTTFKGDPFGWILPGCVCIEHSRPIGDKDIREIHGFFIEI